MKYYLVFGYQTIEKWRDFGRIQLFLNEQLVEDFPAENEKSYNKIFHNVVVNNETSINQYILDSNQDKSFLTNKHPPKQFEYLDKNAVQDYGDRLTAEEFAKFGQYHTYNYKKHQFSLTDTFLKQIQKQKDLKFTYFSSEGKEIEIDDKNDFVNQVLYQKRKIERRKEKVKVLPLQVQNSQPAQVNNI